MKKQLIYLSVISVIIMLITSCEKSDVKVDKFAALEAEKEQIMSYIKENNLENYSTILNTDLTENERLEYVKNIHSNKSELDDLTKKIEIYMEENVPVENNSKLLKANNEILQASMQVGQWPEFPYQMFYYGVSQTSNNIPYIDVIGSFVYNNMYQLHQGYRYAYNSKRVTISHEFPDPSQGPNPAPSGKYEAWGDHWFSFGGGQAANVFSYDIMYLN